MDIDRAVNNPYRLYKVRPIVQFYRDLYPELVAFLESLPVGVLSYEINHRSTESLYEANSLFLTALPYPAIDKVAPPKTRPCIFWISTVSSADTGLQSGHIFSTVSQYSKELFER